MVSSCLHAESECHVCQLPLTVATTFRCTLETSSISQMSEVNMQEQFRPVGAEDGATVAVCEAFAPPDYRGEKVATWSAPSRPNRTRLRPAIAAGKTGIAIVLNPDCRLMAT